MRIYTLVCLLAYLVLWWLLQVSKDAKSAYWVKANTMNIAHTHKKQSPQCLHSSRTLSINQSC